jgi:uncharacterized PurR-regulated membrane protein YhhQ (DUF165 family)
VHIDSTGNDSRDVMGSAMPANSLEEFGKPLNKDSGYYPAFENRSLRPARNGPRSARGAAFRIVGETFLPATTLIALILLTYFLAQRPFGELAALLEGFGFTLPGEAWVNWAIIFVPTSFFAIQLTSRAYGLEIAFLQIVSAWAVALSALFFVPELAVAGMEDLALRALVSLGVALAAAQLVVAVVFDVTRCIRWWQAPFLSGLWASFAFAILFYPMALMGSALQWFDLFLAHLAILVAESMLLLIPYWIIRPLIRPSAGYSGY